MQETDVFLIIYEFYQNQLSVATLHSFVSFPCSLRTPKNDCNKLCPSNHQTCTHPFKARAKNAFVWATIRSLTDLFIYHLALALSKGFEILQSPYVIKSADQEVFLGHKHGNRIA